MSSLRRLAQTNHAINSPRTSEASTQVSPSTPVKKNGFLPTTPRTRIVYPISPITSPSLSASTPFDWEAARARKPPPYASPLGKRVRAQRNGAGSPTRGNKRVVRKKGFIEKITSLPSQIAFEIHMFPHNVPFPSPEKSAWLIGGFMHFLHLCVRISQIRTVPDSDLGWEDMYREDEGRPWFDWTVPVSILLIGASILNAMSLFTRTKIYQLNLAREPVASPNAKFVPRSSSDSSRSSTPTTTSTPSKLISFLFSLLKHFWRAFVISVRFLLNLSPPKSQQTSGGVWGERVQQLEVWTPGELEMFLFSVYSPVHALLWMATNSANWMIMLVVMFITGAQLRAMTRSYEALLKDKAIISAEVLHEYDEKFVYPRINPIRKDAAVMTHEAEMVNCWEDRPRMHTGASAGR
ncbi:hypothetical protein QCA50_003280 [Cerrena zonata]|uniref:Nuclear envelope membrane protein n=1 Tax=Cerrena zonata TaxID=2478898 RepID=A0AAW0GTP4_9APHY